MADVDEARVVQFGIRVSACRLDPNRSKEFEEALLELMRCALLALGEPDDDVLRTPPSDEARKINTPSPGADLSPTRPEVPATTTAPVGETKAPMRATNEAIRATPAKRDGRSILSFDDRTRFLAAYEAHLEERKAEGAVYAKHGFLDALAGRFGLTREQAHSVLKRRGV